MADVVDGKRKAIRWALPESGIVRILRTIARIAMAFRGHTASQTSSGGPPQKWGRLPSSFRRAETR